MSQVSIVRDNAILPYTASHDMTGREGEPISINSDGTVKITQGVDSDPPIGVLVKGGKNGENVSVAIAAGGLAGTVRVKLGANVTHGAIPGGLQLIDGPDGCLFAPAHGVPSAWFMAMALEPGLEGELVEAVLFFPTVIPY